MTLTERLSLTYWHAAQHVARGGRPDQALAAARVAEGIDRDEQLQHVHLQPLRRDRELDQGHDAPPVLGQGRRAADAEGQAVEQPRPVAADGRGLSMTTCTLTATYSGLVDVEIDVDAIAATLPTNAHRNQITDAVRDAAFDLACGEVTGARWVDLDGVQIAVEAVIRALDVKAAREAVSK